MCLALLVAVPRLAGGRGERMIVPVAIDARALTVPTDARGLDSVGAAVRGVSAILSKNFGLAMPPRVTIYVYSGRQAFEDGLVRDARVASALASELSSLTIGIGLQGEVMLNEAAWARTDRERLRLLAHELTHVSQIELAGGEERGERWLAEGMAEWVAYATLERLGLDTMSRRHARALDGVQARSPLVPRRLHLDVLGTPQGFTRWYLREGALPSYQLAFLVSDYLIARDGLGAVRDYFAAFAASGDRRGNFRRTFGESLDAFEDEALAHLRAVMGESLEGATLVRDEPARAPRTPQSR